MDGKWCELKHSVQIVQCISELVDSLCKDGVDAQYMQYLSKKLGILQLLFFALDAVFDFLSKRTYSLVTSRSWVWEQEHALATFELC